MCGFYRSKWVAVTEELRRKVLEEQQAKEAAMRETALVLFFSNQRQLFIFIL